jgi:hypothetical protein
MSEHSMSEAIQQFLRGSKLKGNMQAFQIEEIWEQLMGKTISKYTDKIQIVNHTLFITTTVAALKNELMYQRDKIRQKVNEALKENLIRDVVIQ